ncbi:MAG: NADH-quinone oxidoreductase subunit K [Phycisphaerales bacterium]
MTILMVICVIVIFAVSVYLILGRELKSIAMGVFLFSHGAHLGILSMSGQPLYLTGDGNRLKMKDAPILGIGEHLVDPLPQALILTSIVISFAVMAFLLTLLVTTYRRTETIVIDELAREDRPSAPEPLM